MTWPDNAAGSADDVPGGWGSAKLQKTVGKFSNNPSEHARQSQEAERSAQERLAAAEDRIRKLEERLYDAEQKILAEHP